ncbi:MAG: phosphomethylpyrimidine synthase ThiC [Candidatus Saelkia tenebricola]|nr:phosphomethylpyrimidine synthase ThiC [Candidatus Saelkia tenebricola]
MTLIEKIKKGEIPEFLHRIAEDEEIPSAVLVEKILNGEVVVPYNFIHSPQKPVAIGAGMAIKINVNIGASFDKEDIELEKKKIDLADKLGADAIMDLSVGRDLVRIRRELISKSPMPFGTVPIYEAAVHGAQCGGNITNLKVDDFFTVLENQAKDGVDFFTIHSGIDLEAIEKLKKDIRILDVVSRGGALLLEWMIVNQKENPYYQYFDRVLDITKKYGVTISLGDALRPGSIFDAGDVLQYHETFIIADLLKRAKEADVQVMVEGPGHVPLHKVEHEIKSIKEIINNAPLYVLGPLVIDSAAGYDHINAAIGAAVAGYTGADFLCYLTPAEHLCLPDLEDVRDGIMAFKIAAQAVNVARGKRKYLEREYQISKARKERNWTKQIQLALDSDKASEYRNKIPPGITDTCSMCGEYCSIKIVEAFLTKKGNEDCERSSAVEH